MQLNKKKIILSISILVFAMFIISVAGFVYLQYRINEPYNLSSNIKKEFTIKSGESVQEIATDLEDRNLINDPDLFKFYVWQKKIGGKLQAGSYELSPSMSIPEIANLFIGGKIKSNEISITIPEGFSNQEIDKRLAENSLIEKGDFINFSEVNNLDLSKYKFLRDKPVNARLQGYFFPDTYQYYGDSSVEDIVKKMLDNFDRKISQELREEIKKQNKSIFETLILASIIEKEAGFTEDMGKVSSVFHNRLEIDYLLESDATINYITESGRSQSTYEDLQIDSPYNTYKYAGLPPTPICNPGLNAIKAAIYPEETNYFFFLTSSDRKAIFSKTYEEHLKNKSKYLK
ncbi:MAG: endolytic transglycosylase MltG [Patescibacteria group bacterium]|nr:endolytic transglycosylase MltG [Patescibacteria group bacterium]